MEDVNTQVNDCALQAAVCFQPHLKQNLRIQFSFCLRLWRTTGSPQVPHLKYLQQFLSGLLLFLWTLEKKEKGWQNQHVNDEVAEIAAAYCFWKAWCDCVKEMLFWCWQVRYGVRWTISGFPSKLPNICHPETNLAWELSYTRSIYCLIWATAQSARFSVLFLEPPTSKPKS